MSRRFVVGLTGGIASGKSTVLRLFAQSRVPVISSDELAHQCLKRGHPTYKKILRRYGSTVIGPKNEINRRGLGQIVFSNPKERRWLERQIHPWVIRSIAAFIRKHQGLIVADIPLLYEAGLKRMVDAVVVVWSPRRDQIKRLAGRNGLARGEALRRIAAQLNLDKKRQRADYVLTNNGSLVDLRRQYRRLLPDLKKSLTVKLSRV